MFPAFDEAEPCLAQCLTHRLVCRSFGMREHFGAILSRKFRPFHFIRLPVTADSEGEVEIGMEIVCHRIAVIKIVRHHEIADIQHHLLRAVRQGLVGCNVVMVDISLDFP